MDEFAMPKISFITILENLVSSEYTEQLTRFSKQKSETLMAQKDDSAIALKKENK